MDYWIWLLQAVYYNYPFRVGLSLTESIKPNIYISCFSCRRECCQLCGNHCISLTLCRFVSLSPPSPLVVCASLQMFWIWVFVLQESLTACLFLCVFVSVLSFLSAWLPVCPPSWSPWWGGGCVAQLLSVQLHMEVAQRPPSFIFIHIRLQSMYNFVILISPYCPSVHPGIPPLLLFLLLPFLGEFFLIWTITG